jgi:hypothetical protein
MHITRVMAAVAAVTGIVSAVPTNKKAELAPAWRQTTEFGPYPEDDYAEKKRQTTEFGPYPEDDYAEKKH